MVKADETLLQLLQCAVSGQCNGLIQLVGVDWPSLIAQSNRQAVVAIAIDGLQKYLSAHPDVKPFAQETVAEKMRRMQWLGQVMAYERMYAKQEYVMAKLSQAYAKKGIRMMVLKGYGLSLDWPTSCHRTMGDLDIYNFGRWKKADALIAKEYGVNVDDGHEHHTVFCFEGVAVENHYDFINTKAHRDAPMIEAKTQAAC